ncbi:MAG: hypothetical protein ABL900_02845 [Burkholderiaceae bacterium]
MIRTALLVTTLCCSGIVDAATTIYRCGPGGREYSQRPCADGTVVEGTDGRTGAQRAAAARAVEQEKRRAAELERERLAEERKKVSPPIGINGLARPGDVAASAADGTAIKSQSGKVKSKAKQPQESKDFLAVEPVTKKK